MKTTIAVYDSHDKALDAVTALKNAGFPVKNVSLVGQAELVNDHLHSKTLEDVSAAPISVGVLAGAALGVLTGVGLFAIPGLGFLYGAGAIVGAFAGLDAGLLGGVAVSVFELFGLKRGHTEKYEALIKAGNFLVIAQEDDTHAKDASAILTQHGGHLEIGIN